MTTRAKVTKVFKDAERIKKIDEKIAELEAQRKQIQEENRWTDYMGRGVQEIAPGTDPFDFNDACQIIKYGSKVR